MKLTRRHLLVGAGLTAASLARDASRKSHADETKAAVPNPQPDLGPRERLLLDPAWRFHFGHAQDPERDFGFGLHQRTFAKQGSNLAAAAQLVFDDTAWTKIDLPHDWAIDLPFERGANPLAQEDPRAAHGFKPLGREYPQTSIGWYRRTFDLPKEDLGRRISLEFDGVFRDCLVFFNGYLLANNESGYAPFRVDVTDVAEYGAKNVLTVRVDATLGEGWFYEGAGIYRHVWLVKTSPVHVPQWGTFVRAEVAGSARVTITTEVRNEGDRAAAARVVSVLLGPDGRELERIASDPVSVEPFATGSVDQAANIPAPALWSIETPQLHELATEIEVDGKIVDRYRTPFGLRTIRFDADRGFFLNGVPVKLLGTCNHQDHAGVGAALPDRLQDFRIEKLKSMGSNAYRTAHNPPTSELLDACDRIGMLVIDETRRMSSDPESLSELERMIRRDRNHPSIILWSLGNEEQGQQGNERGARIMRSMKRLTNRLDPTRLVTAAMDNDFEKGIANVIDVIGFNYRTNKIVPHHRRMPRQPIIGSETGSTVCTRGIYERDDARGFAPAYDTDHPWWATTAEEWWTVIADHPFAAGGFIWTGFDYRGEPTPFNRWPSISTQFGVMDTCGFPKDNFQYYRAWWSAEPLLHLFPHWNWAGREGKPISVWCHSNLDRVELYLNGRKIGAKAVTRNRHVEWKVPYEPGVIEARGLKGGAVVLTARRETTGPAAAIALKPDRTTIRGDGEDVVVVVAEIQDADGRAHPHAADEVTFAVSGPGAVIGVGNGDPTSHEADRASKRNAFNGLCMAIVQARRAAGEIRVEASAPGLRAAAGVVTAMAAAPRPFVA